MESGDELGLECVQPGTEIQQKLDTVFLNKCSENTEAEQMHEAVSTFLASIMKDHSLLTRSEISVLDVGHELGWTTEDVYGNLLAALAIEVASVQGIDITAESARYWVTQAFPMQEILKHAFLLQKEYDTMRKQSSQKLAKAKRKQEQLQRSIEVKKSRSDKALSRAAALLEEDPDERDIKLSKRNAVNRENKGINKTKKDRPSDKACTEQAPSMQSCALVC